MANLAEKAAAAETVANAAKELKDLDPKAQLEFVQRAMPSPDQSTTNLLWLIFVAGVLVLISVFGKWVYNLIVDADAETDPAVLAQLLTFLAGALVGLFVKSPVQT